MKCSYAFHSLATIITVFSYCGVSTAADLEKFFRMAPHPACGFSTFTDHQYSVCEWDDAKAAANQCSETKPVFKEVSWKICAHVANGPLPPQVLDQSGTVPGGPKLKRVALTLLDVALPTPQSLSPDGPWMPAECSDSGKKISAYFKAPRAYRRLDNDVPGWRDCMNSFAKAIAEKSSQFPDIVLLNKLQDYFLKLDTSDTSIQANLDAFVLAMEDEPVRPVPFERALQLLGVP